MTPAPSGLAQPPADPGALAGFPAAPAVAELHRLSEFPGAWWYSAVDVVGDPAGGRFDLERPQGTCYLAESFDGAVVEKLLRAPVKVVVAERLDELFHASVTVRASRPAADLTDPRATRFGVNAEIHSRLDYALPRRWAAALRRAGWRALRHRLRGDVTGRLAGRALFGAAGLHARAPAGMTTTVAPLDRTRTEQALHGRGVDVRPIPAHVPTTPPPA